MKKEVWDLRIQDVICLDCDKKMEYYAEDYAVDYTVDFSTNWVYYPEKDKLKTTLISLSKENVNAVILKYKKIIDFLLIQVSQEDIRQ